MSRNNKKSRESASSQSSKWYLLAALVALAGGIAWYLQARRAPEVAVNGAGDAGAADEQGKPKAKADKSGVEPGHHSVVAKAEYLSEVPWKEFRLTERGALRIVLQPRLWCTIGDLDAIALDGHLSDNPRFLLTVEPLNPEDTSLPPMTRVLTLKDFQKGMRHEFSLPPLKKGIQLGIFLCKDTAGEGRCNTDSKEVADINRMLADSSKSMKEDKKYRSPDRVYYFQYLYLEESNRLRAFQNPEVPDITFDAVQEQLKKARAERELEAQLRALGRAKRFQQTLRSLPLEQGNGYAKIVLPLMDHNPKHCPKVAQRPAAK